MKFRLLVKVYDTTNSVLNSETEPVAVGKLCNLRSWVKIIAHSRHRVCEANSKLRAQQIAIARKALSIPRIIGAVIRRTASEPALSSIKIGKKPAPIDRSLHRYFFGGIMSSCCIIRLSII